MKLKDLLPISSLQEVQGDALSIEYFRKFSECCDYNVVVSKAYIVAKITKKHAMFGLVYVLNGLEKLDATICKVTRKEKDGHVNLECIKFDAEDKKNFSGDDVKFKNVIK